jgi:hypothetical protein
VGHACGLDFIPCAVDGQIGPCVIDFPYCPLVF